MLLKKDKISKKEKSCIEKESKSGKSKEKKNSRIKLSKLEFDKLREEENFEKKNLTRKQLSKEKPIEEKSSLQSVIEALLTRQLEDQTLDFQIKTMGLDPAFAMGAYVLDSDMPISYSALFSYLGGKAKENPYLNYFEVKRKEREDKEKKETQAKELSYDKIALFMMSGRLKQVTNVESYEATPLLKEKYEYFKIFNQAYSFLLYQMLR